jgi:hypothetical protein
MRNSLLHRQSSRSMTRAWNIRANIRKIASESVFGTRTWRRLQGRRAIHSVLKKGARGVQPTLAVQVFGGSAHSNIAIDFGFRGVGTTNSKQLRQRNGIGGRGASLYSPMILLM